jgi:hypothetical protein
VIEPLDEIEITPQAEIWIVSNPVKWTEKDSECEAGMHDVFPLSEGV